MLFWECKLQGIKLSISSEMHVLSSLFFVVCSLTNNKSWDEMWKRMGLILAIKSSSNGSDAATVYLAVAITTALGIGSCFNSQSAMPVLTRVLRFQQDEQH